MKRDKYTAEQLDFLRAQYASMAIPALTVAFNARFSLEKTAGQIKSTLHNHEIRCGRAPRERKIPCRFYTDEQVLWLRNNYEGRSVVELTKLYNERWETNRTIKQINAAVKNRGFKSGRTGQFEKGSRPWNTGTKGATSRNVTSFKKGVVPPNRRPLGSERICSKDGYILIKVAELNPHTGHATRYKHKHIWLWEQANGPVPEGMVVSFVDQNKLNCVLGNLMLVSKAEMQYLTRHNYKDLPEELKPTLRVLTKVEVKRRKLLRERRV